MGECLLRVLLGGRGVVEVDSMSSRDSSFSEVSASYILTYRE